MDEKKTIFQLPGNRNGKHAFNVLIERQGIVEKHKKHLEGGKPIVADDLDVAIVEYGTTKRIKINTDDLIKQLEDIEKTCPSFVKWINKPKRKEIKE